MKLLIDANILLDVLQHRKPYVCDSSAIWKLCEADKVNGYVSALTFANLVYIMRKEMTPGKIEEILHSLSLIFKFTEVNPSDLMCAAQLNWDDFEDAIQSVTAERIRADYIITRNVKDFAQSRITALTPAELITRI